MSDKVLGYILFGVKAVLGLAGVIIFMMILMGEKTDSEGQPLHSVASIDAGLVLSYIISVLCLLVWIFFGIFNIATNLKKSLPLLGSVLVFGIVFAISYSMASDEIMETWKKKPELFTPGNIKWSDVGLYIMYATMIFTVLTIVVTEVTKLFK